VAKTIEDEIEHRDAEKARDKIIRDLIAARKHLRAEVKTVIDEAELAGEQLE
jgi:hypothetical protein